MSILIRFDLMRFIIVRIVTRRDFHDDGTSHQFLNKITIRIVKEKSVREASDYKYHMDI